MTINLQSDDLKDLAIALVNAQKELGTVKKDADNPFFKSKYATLSACIEESRPVLTKNGLAVTQTTLADEGQNVLVTTLLHSSGQYLRGTYPINPVKQDPQGIGSAITYARRYAYSAILGLAQEDDYGEKAVTHTAEPVSTASDMLCPIHKVKTVKKTNASGNTFWSHRQGNAWCNVDPTVVKKGKSDELTDEDYESLMQEGS